MAGFTPGRDSYPLPPADRHTRSYPRRTTIIVRSCHDTEASDVLALWQRADAEPTHTDDVESILALLRLDHEALIVAVDQGEIVGSVIGAWDGWRGSIYRLVVDAEYRRKGLGRLLLAEAERRLHAKGARRLAAIVVQTDLRAAGFWRNSGWEEQLARLRFVMG
jgi:ribosomal protein S18 acetylase RimI-like enzyme